MDVASTTGATAGTAGTGTAGTGAAAGKTKTTDETAATGIAGDFTTFLSLLTAQMRNQDPLKPMDSTEFVSQLASFSGVEQQVRANDRLQGILDVLSGGSPAGLAEWIGREVQVKGKADFAGDAIDVGVTPVAGADKAVLVVKNDFDQVVARVSVAADAASVAWDGKNALGAVAPNGRYGFALESYQGDTLLGMQDGRVFTTVREVRIEDGAPVLVVADGSQVPIDEVGAVR